jgi:hypothetical protein
MSEKARTLMSRILTLVVAIPLLLFSKGVSAERGIQPNDTQIVAQWLLPPPAIDQQGLWARVRGILSLYRYFRVESAIERAAEGLYFEDGNDIGSGTFNVFIYTDQVDRTVARLIDLERSGKVPVGLRIGVAQYKNKERTDWTYSVAYPPTLTNFELIYR